MEMGKKFLDFFKNIIFFIKYKRRKITVKRAEELNLISVCGVCRGEGRYRVLIRPTFQIVEGKQMLQPTKTDYVPCHVCRGSGKLTNERVQEVMDNFITNTNE